MHLTYILTIVLMMVGAPTQGVDCDGGDCLPYHRCLYAKKLKKVPYCADGSVCCRPPTRPTNNSPSSRACQDYSNDQSFCPPELLISHSNGTDRHERQYMAVIGKRSRGSATEKPEWICGGTVIHERYVLTAAHCILLVDEDPDFFVGLGAYNKSESQVYPVVKAIHHRDYDELSLVNDIALLQLNETIVFNAKIKPACLATSPVEDHEALTVSGWGYLDSVSQKQPDELRKADLQVLNISDCSQASSDMHICAGGVNNISDVCNGDSGGPLAKWHPRWGGCLGQVIGIVSNGGLCDAQYPRTKFTNVYFYVEWIESIVWPSKVKK
ncbi:beta-fibrinogenase brevinase-like isoform X1 [Drosophila santomea]|uniref:beta-fibrinogenase brevinase-like isoform X1 n=1 Tax=Drosophila santomea TaxID=129105 RepID=UPI001954AD34|nr:beta-fibrinogenase brevinase-like isoform X1 [Drosophila santomea]